MKGTKRKPFTVITEEAENKKISNRGSSKMIKKRRKELTVTSDNSKTCQPLHRNDSGLEGKEERINLEFEKLISKYSELEGKVGVLNSSTKVILQQPPPSLLPSNLPTTFSNTSNSTPSTFSFPNIQYSLKHSHPLSQVSNQVDTPKEKKREREELRGEIEKREREELREEIEKREREELREEVTLLLKERGELRGKLEKVEKEKKEAVEAVEQLSFLYESSVSSNEEMEKKTKKWRIDCEGKQKQKEKLLQHLNQVREERDRLSFACELIVQENEKLRQDFSESLQEVLSQQKKKMALLEEENSKWKSTVLSIQQVQKELLSNYKNCVEKVVALENELSQQKQLNEHLEKELASRFEN